MKPIAGVNKYPFGLSGITVLAAKDEAGNSLAGLRILKQCSGYRFNLQSADGASVYSKLQLVSAGTDGTVFVASTAEADVKSKLGAGQFVIQVYGTDGVLLGYAQKITEHRIVLGDGSVATGIDLAVGSTGIAVTAINVTSSAAVSVVVGETSTIAWTVAPANASNKTVTFSSSDAAIATVSGTGVITAVAEGSATITLKNGDVTKTVAVTVTAAAE